MYIHKQMDTKQTLTTRSRLRLRFYMEPSSLNSKEHEYSQDNLQYFCQQEIIIKKTKKCQSKPKT